MENQFYLLLGPSQDDRRGPVEGGEHHHLRARQGWDPSHQNHHQDGRIRFHFRELHQDRQERGLGGELHGLCIEGVQLHLRVKVLRKEVLVQPLPHQGRGVPRTQG